MSATTAKARGLLLGSSPAIDSARVLVARFYCTEPERVTLTCAHAVHGAQQFTVKVGEREIDGVRVFQVGKRFQFATTKDTAP
jgi:hypothetical protein